KLFADAHELHQIGSRELAAHFDELLTAFQQRRLRRLGHPLERIEIERFGGREQREHGRFVVATARDWQASAEKTARTCPFRVSASRSGDSETPGNQGHDHEPHQDYRGETHPLLTLGALTDLCALLPRATGCAIGRTRLALGFLAGDHRLRLLPGPLGGLLELHRLRLWFLGARLLFLRATRLQLSLDASLFLTTLAFLTRL